MAKVGRKLSEEHKRKIGDANRGRKFTPEQRMNMSLARIGNKSHLGHKHSEEARKKMSEAAKGNTSHLGKK